MSACCCLAALLLAGCGGESAYDGPERFAVSGTVSLDGAPLDYGTISFIPTDEAAQRVAGAEIEKGQYVIAAEFGPNAGEYKVAISSIKRDASAGADVGENESPSEEAAEDTGENEDEGRGEAVEYDSDGNAIEAGERISSEYSDPEVTSLTAKIGSGEETKNFEVMGR